MSTMTKLRYALARFASKGAGVSFVPSWIRTTFLEPSFDRLTREGYQANAAVFACISALAFSYTEPPLIVVDRKTDKRLPEHALQKLLNRPNPMMGGKGLALYQTIYKSIGGQTMLHKVRSGDKEMGPVIQLWPYHIGQMVPEAGGETWIDHYSYYTGPGAPTPIAAHNVIQLKWPSVDTAQPYLAMPPLRAIARDVDTDNEAARYLYALLFNDAIPRTALTIPPGINLSDGQFERLRQQFAQKHGGDNRGNVAVVEGGAKIERIGLDLEQMAFDALRKVPETRIAAAFRVPAIIAGLNAGLDRSTYSNFGEARSQFTQDTLVPMWELDADEFDQELSPEFGDKIRIRYDLDKVKALQEDVDKKFIRAVSGWNSGLMKKNEARRIIGLDEDMDGDVYKISPVNPALMPRAAATIIDATPARPALTDGKRRRAPQRKTTRESVTGKIEKAVQGYLAEEYQLAADQVSEFENPDDIRLDNGNKIASLMRRYYPLLLDLAAADASATLGIELAFDLENERVQEVLDELAGNVKGVAETTRADIQRLVGQMAKEGWSIEQLSTEISTLGEIASKSRATTIARTESATGYNRASLLGYEEAGIVEVEVLDGDDDEACQAANGQVWTLAQARTNLIEHPNCERTFVPLVR